MEVGHVENRRCIFSDDYYERVRRLPVAHFSVRLSHHSEQQTLNSRVQFVREITFLAIPWRTPRALLFRGLGQDYVCRRPIKGTRGNAQNRN